MRWDIFCKVIDNHGDIGVCWRLAVNLASRGHLVRLWVDDATALQWMAPQGAAGVEVLAWPQSAVVVPPSDVWIEAFGCDIPEAWLVAQTTAQPPPSTPATWLNLEYLSAEPYVERVHGLPSPVLAGPAKGRVKHFFYPGFSALTGGLLREADLVTRQAHFDRHAWAAQHHVNSHEAFQWFSLFCYEPTVLPGLLRQLASRPTPSRLFVTAGRATAAVQRALADLRDSEANWNASGQLALTCLPHLTQRDYDHLLWACDFNFVRGEDSLVRALWANRPFAWQIYPQDDDAHHDKLRAFVELLGPPPDWAQFHWVWNGLLTGPLPQIDLPNWTPAARPLAQKLAAQDDLCSQLIRFTTEKR